MFRFSGSTESGGKPAVGRRVTRVEPNARLEGDKPFFRMARIRKNNAQRSVSRRQIQAECQRPLGLGTRAPVIATRIECQR
jgi:hypothetical protein